MSQKIELAKAVAAIRETARYDNEGSHEESDQILLAYLRATGAGDLADAWQARSDQCGGFWYA